MRVPWSKSRPIQLDLLSPTAAIDKGADATLVVNVDSPPAAAKRTSPGQPLMVSTSSLREDRNNPRTEFPKAELEELAEDIRRHGILQPIVVHPVDAAGHYQIHFGAKRWRVAQLLELQAVPVVVRDAATDPYTQVAENQKRHGLVPLDLARFIRGRVDAGDSNATVAKRLGMNLTTVAHHLALLELPPELDEALKSGRCTSPRTLHELSKLYDEKPDQVRALVAGGAEITRAAVSSIGAERMDAATTARSMASDAKRFAQANAACDRLEQALKRIDLPVWDGVADPELTALRARITNLANRWR